MEHKGRGKKGPETDPQDRGRLRRLQKQISDMTEKDAFVDAIVESNRDEKARAALKANPKAELEKKGFTIPDEVDVEVTEESPYCVGICFGWWIFRWCIWICG